MTYYRKYRPQSLKELVGQEAVKQTLQTAFDGQKLSHAYLFCGPRGTGKTSTARILAKMVNCENQPSGNLKTDNSSIPCNSCSSCISITDGTNLDVYEIDAASNRGIDDIRSLREKIKLAPSLSKKKVYIIDEVHMLTSEAFNALLKTLEEPPAHVMFILATTESQKIPTTILSRVQRLDFKLASIMELFEALDKVSRAEGIKISEDALKLIAKKSEGGFRDALKLLDQLASENKEISIEDIEKLVKSGRFEEMIEILDALAKKDASQALLVFGRHLDGGVNVKEYTLSLIDALRAILYIKEQAGVIVKHQQGEARYETLIKMSEGFTIVSLLKIINCIHQSLEKLKYTSIPSLPLEVALVECCLETHELKKPIEVPAEIKQAINIVNTAPAQEGEVSSPPSSLSDDAISIPQESSDMATIQDKWTYILETVKPFNFSLEALLRSIRLLGVDDGIVLLEVPYSFHQRILETPRNREMLESIFSDVLGKPTKLGCVLGKRPTRIEDVANVELAQEDDVIRLAAEIFNSDV